MLLRVLRAAGTLFAIATTAFLAMRVIPGNPAMVQLGDYATPELIVAVEASLGLDRPLGVQYFSFLTDLVRGDLGYSFRSRTAVTELLGDNVSYTMQLAFAGFLMALVIGIVAGATATRFRNKLPDRLIVGVSTVALSAPPFWTGLILIFVFSLHFGWFPVSGGGVQSEPGSIVRHLALPAFAIGAREAGIIARVVRSAMAVTMRRDFVLVAAAKGIGQRAVLVGHVLRNALLPVASMAAVRLITLLSGIFVVEIVFARPGLGTLLVEAIRSRDFPVVQGVVLLIGLFVIIVNLIGDAVYAWVDPRVRVRA